MIFSRRFNMKTKFLWFIPLICVSILAVLLNIAKGYDIEMLKDYTQPYCKDCVVAYSSDKCEKCGGSIKDKGVFYDRGSSDFVEFISKFKTYKEYNKYYSDALNLGVSTIMMVVLAVSSLFVAVYLSIDEGIKKLLKKKGSKKYKRNGVNK